MQEQNKGSLPRVVAICPLNPLVSPDSSSTSSLTTTDVETVVQQVLSQTSITLFVISGKRSWLFDTTC